MITPRTVLNTLWIFYTSYNLRSESTGSTVISDANFENVDTTARNMIRDAIEMLPWGFNKVCALLLIRMHDVDKLASKIKQLDKCHFLAKTIQVCATCPILQDFRKVLQK